MIWNHCGDLFHDDCPLVGTESGEVALGVLAWGPGERAEFRVVDDDRLDWCIGHGMVLLGLAGPTKNIIHIYYEKVNYISLPTLLCVKIRSTKVSYIAKVGWSGRVVLLI